MGSAWAAKQDPYDRALYSVNFDGSHLKRLTPEVGDHYISVAQRGDGVPSDDSGRFSPSGHYFVDTFSSPNEPPVFVVREEKGGLIRRLETADISLLEKGGYVPVEPFQVLAADGKTAIFGNLFRPSGFDPAGKYPVIDSLYPGPSATRTKKTYLESLFDPYETQSLAELGFIVITIDGRGTPLRPKGFSDESYGHLELASNLDDHLAALTELAHRYPSLDLTHVGVDGVSAGGYAAARALLQYPNFFKVGVASEGYHDPRLMLSAWADTYMGQADEAAFMSASNLSIASNLQGHLLLMHGELDRTVPARATFALADHLFEAHRDFELLVVPNTDHGTAFSSPYFLERKWAFFVHYLSESAGPT